MVRKYLRRFGIEPERDAQIIQIGGIPELLAAMKTGAISGGADFAACAWRSEEGRL